MELLLQTDMIIYKMPGGKPDFAGFIRRVAKCLRCSYFDIGKRNAIFY